MNDIDKKILETISSGISEEMKKECLKLYTLHEENKEAFFTRNKELKHINLPEYFNRGQSARVYLLNEFGNQIVFKKYFPLVSESIKIKPLIFDMLKSLDNPNIINTIEDFYCDEESNSIAAYTYYYVEENKVNLIEDPKSYLLDNLYSLEALISYFSRESILISDLKFENTILNKEKIVLIDPDCFDYRPMLKENFIVARNKRELINLMRDLVAHYTISPYFKRNFDTLFSKDLESEKSITRAVSKRLQFKKRLIDYMK